MIPDVLIIGSGPAGISTAWPLLAAGLSVTMIDAGQEESLPSSPVATSFAGWKSNPDRWRDVLGSDLGGLVVNTDYSPKFSTPLGRSVLQSGLQLHPAIQANNAIVTRAGVTGGLSSIWGGFCTAYDDADLKNFPFGASALAEGYKKTAERIGITGLQDDLADFHGSHFPLMAPPPLNQPTEQLLKNYKTRKSASDLKLGHARNAVTMKDQGTRKGCVQCGLCLYGCGHKSIYNSRDELEALQKFPNFTYRPHSTAVRLVLLGNETQSIEVKDKTGLSIIMAKRLVLAAGTLNTTALLMAYYKLYSHTVRLLHNPVAGMAFIVPKFLGQKMPEHSFGLGRLSYRLALDQAGNYATGVVYGADTLPHNLFAERMPFTRPASLALSAAMAPAMMMSTCYLSSDGSDMTLSLQHDGERPQLVLNGSIKTETSASLLAAGKKLGKEFAACGAYLIPGSLTVSPPGSDAHLAGTVPMGGQGPLSCKNNGELSESSGVFVVDGSWFPRLPPKHCTFSIMANAYRVGSDIAKNRH